MYGQIVVFIKVANKTIKPLKRGFLHIEDKRERGIKPGSGESSQENHHPVFKPYKFTANTTHMMIETNNKIF